MPEEKAINQIENSDGVPQADLIVRNVRKEAGDLRLQSLTVAQSTIENKKDEEISPLQKPTASAFHCDLFIAHVNTLLNPEVHPQVSKFLKSSQQLFHTIHIMDDLLSSNRQFYQSNKQWNPLISRYYYGVLDVIQTLRAMEEADILDSGEKLFLHQFLNRFPPQSLSIAGPLISYFQSICVSQCQYPTFGEICPILPHSNQYHPRGLTGAPSFTYVNYMIPNIPGIVSMINQLGSPGRRAQLADSTLHIPYLPIQNVPGAAAPAQAELNGVAYPSTFADLPEASKWYFTSPGMEYPNEADLDSLKAFSQQVYKLGFPTVTAAARFGSIQKYLFMETPNIFSKINAIMAKVNKHFANSGNLSHCPPRGCPAGQVICRRMVPISPPETYGDESCLLSGAFSAYTVNHEISQSQAQFAYASKINSVYPAVEGSTHPLSGVGDSLYNDNVRSGPFWDSSTLVKETLTDEGYLRYPELIRTKYYLEKPEN